MAGNLCPQRAPSQASRGAPGPRRSAPPRSTSMRETPCDSRNRRVKRPRTTAGVACSRRVAAAPRPSKSHRAAEGDVVQNAAKGFSRISRSRPGSRRPRRPCGRGPGARHAPRGSRRRSGSSGRGVFAARQQDSPAGQVAGKPLERRSRRNRRPRTRPPPLAASASAVTGPTATTMPPAVALRKREALRSVREERLHGDLAREDGDVGRRFEKSGVRLDGLDGMARLLEDLDARSSTRSGRRDSPPSARRAPWAGSLASRPRSAPPPRVPGVPRPRRGRASPPPPPGPTTLPAARSTRPARRPRPRA